MASEFTALVRRAQDGDAQAGEEAFALLYGDLKQLARSRLAHSARDPQLDTSSLVHETYLRLARAGGLGSGDRRSYLAYASRAMRSVIVDLVRTRSAERHGGGLQRITLNTDLADGVHSGEEEIVRVHEALEELAAVNERLVRVVEMRYFAGLTEGEIAEALGVSERTVRRDWEKARLLLLAALR